MIEIQPGVELYGSQPQLNSDDFEIEFSSWLDLHMYPLLYGKENTMQKLSHDHISAVTNAQRLLETAVDVAGNKQLDASIRRDIALLCQLREILYYAFENPTLPFPINGNVTEPISVTNENKTNPNISEDEHDRI